VKDRLLRQHRRMLKKSAISREVWEARGYRTVKLPATLKRHGFGSRQVNLTPGLLIPLYDINGNNARYQFRSDQPREDKDGRVIKYENPRKTGVILDIHPFALEGVMDARTDLWITEGVKKADALVTAGEAAVALSSVWGWRGTDDKGNIRSLPEWDQIPFEYRDPNTNKRVKRVVYIVFDSDVMRKHEVKLALERLWRLLKRPADVKLVYLPEGEHGEKQGVDDYLYNGGDLDDLIEQAADKPKKFEVEDTEYHYTDLGNAKRLYDMFGERLRFCPAHKSWYVWNGKIWERDDMLEINRMTSEMTTKMMSDGLEIEDHHERQRAVAWAVTSESTSKVNALIEAARPLVTVHPTSLDSDPMLFCVENGVIDLETGRLHQFDPTNLISRMAPQPYEADADDDRWEDVLNRFVRKNDNDGEFEAFLQRAAFASLTGKTTDKAFLNLYDEMEGNTGKTTFVESLLSVLGPYGATVNAESFLSRGNSDRIRADLAACYGMRMVSSNEIQSGKLDTALMKKLTAGHGNLRFERKYENPWEGPITFTIWLDGNELPKARVEDSPLFSRWRLVPFKHKIRHPREGWMERAIADVEYRKAVLAWIMQGRKDWLRYGIGSAPAVEEAVVQVRREMDPLNEFWRAHIVFEEDAFVKSEDLRDRYHYWATMTGNREIADRHFSSILRSKGGINTTKKMGGHVFRGWKGLRLRKERK
jgi:putative DNA primase/helicase